MAKESNNIICIKTGQRDMKQKIITLINEEIAYLENHVKKANEGTRINNIERVDSWIFEAKEIRRMILELK